MTRLLAGSIPVRHPKRMPSKSTGVDGGLSRRVEEGSIPFEGARETGP